MRFLQKVRKRLQLSLYALAVFFLEAAVFAGKMVFSQLMEHLPLHEFHKCLKRFSGGKYTRSFSCLDQFCCLAIGQLTHRESLRDIEICLRTRQTKLYHLGIRGRVSRSTLAEANKNRDYRIFEDFAKVLIDQARILYAKETFGLTLKATAYALDATTIDLCLPIFPWAKFRSAKGGIKANVLLNLRGNIPAFVHICPANVHEINILDLLLVEAGAFYIVDRGYLDFERLFKIHQGRAFL